MRARRIAFAVAALLAVCAGVLWLVGEAGKPDLSLRDVPSVASATDSSEAFTLTVSTDRSLYFVGEQVEIAVALAYDGPEESGTAYGGQPVWAVVLLEEDTGRYVVGFPQTADQRAYPVERGVPLAGRMNTRDGLWYEGIDALPKGKIIVSASLSVPMRENGPLEHLEARAEIVVADEPR